MSKELDTFFKSFIEADEHLDYRMAHEVVGQKIPSISTGSLLLDDALSCGGIPTGRIIQFYGRASSGKTLMTMLTMKEAQKLDPDAKQLFIDAEQTFSPDWAETLGLDASRIIVVDGDLAANGRRCFEMLLGVPKEDAKHVLVGKKTEGLFDKIAKGELNINLVVLDSLGAIIPPGEDVSAVGKANMALLSRFLTPTFRKLSLEVSKAKAPMIVINHTRDNMDPYGVDHTFSGGNTYNHSLSANVYFEAVTRKDAQILDEKENKIGHTIRASIEKSKFGPTKKCEFKVNFSMGVVGRNEEIAQLALDYDVVTKPTTVSHEYGERKWVGFAKFCEGIKEDFELAEELTQKISEARDAKFDKKRAEQEALKNKESSATDDLAEITKKAKKSK
jgi:recombination protein RecA